MAMRLLLAVASGNAVGSVHSGVRGAFSGAAVSVFREIRERLGDTEAARVLIEEGWSNGYLYLGPVSP